MTISGKVVYCDCCGTQKLAEIVGENLVIKDRRHGEKHLAVIPITGLLDNIPTQALIDKLANQGYILISKPFVKGAEEPAKQTEHSAAPAMI